jgi:transposase
VSRYAPPMTDEDILEILTLHEVDGYSFSQIARMTGRTRNAIAGLKRRINWDTDPVDETPHLNGTMPPRWWQRESRA